MSIAASGKLVEKGKGGERRGKAAEHGGISSSGGNHHCSMIATLTHFKHSFPELMGKERPRQFAGLLFTNPLYKSTAKFSSCMTWPGYATLIKVPMHATAGL